MGGVCSGTGGSLMPLYFANPAATCAPRRSEIERAIAEVVGGDKYVLGPQVATFEAGFASYCETAHAVGVGSGTDALSLALLAANVGPGDEVITVSHTAVATAAAIARIGAVPVFVDTDPQSYTMDFDGLAAALSPKTKAVIPVHLYGQAADMDPILDFARDNGLVVIEDCAQAHGARYNGRRVGSMGDFGCFSFYPTKNLGGIGDGGAVVTQNGEAAERVRQLREYGWDKNRISQSTGLNSRLDELQAAILNVNLKYLDQDTQRRRAIAAQYGTALAQLPIDLPKVRPDCEHVYHLYVIAVDQRDDLMTHLSNQGVVPGIHYAVPVHMQPAYQLNQHPALEVTEQAAGRILSLPMYPALNDAEVALVVTAVCAFYD